MISGHSSLLYKLPIMPANTEETQIYGAILPESLTSPEMKETKAYKTYFVSTEESMGKSKRVKRPAKKSTKAPARGIVIRETPEMPLSKKKEKKSMRDFHKTHPSGSGVPDVTEEESSKSEAESWGNYKDDRNNDQDSSGEDSDQENAKENEKDDEEEEGDKFVKTSSNDSNDENETKFTDKAEGDEDEEMYYTTRNENPEITQVIEDTHVTLTAIPQKTEVPVTSSSHSSDLAAKFLNFLDIPHMDA
ncbi:hypothetical protein Tco_0747867 [Tanacetum coccineum]|uniref:Uncharacterized protein n=1 Tax=Tanacetum coccineum TaxID=301880 RepID=A0ABQ4YV56_9ASTR